MIADLLPLGNGCKLHVDPNPHFLTVPAATDPSGVGLAPLPIANDAALAYLMLFVQHAVIDPSGAFGGQFWSTRGEMSSTHPQRDGGPCPGLAGVRSRVDHVAVATTDPGGFIHFVSGRWLGYYQQMRRRFAQEQTMEFADGMLRGDGNDSIGTFRIEGQYRHDGGIARVGWIKTYDGGHSVLYLGTFDGRWILGQWELSCDGDDFGFAPEAIARAEGWS